MESRKLFRKMAGRRWRVDQEIKNGWSKLLPSDLRPSATPEFRAAAVQQSLAYDSAGKISYRRKTLMRDAQASRLEGRPRVWCASLVLTYVIKLSQQRPRLRSSSEISRHFGTVASAWTKRFLVSLE